MKLLKKHSIFIILGIVILIILTCLILFRVVIPEQTIPDDNIVNSTNNEKIEIRDPEKVIISDKLNFNIKNLYIEDKLINIALNYIGYEYPNIKYKDESEEVYNLYDIKKPIILEYSSAYCEACLLSIDPIENVKKLYSDKYEFITMINKKDPNSFDIFRDRGLLDKAFYLDESEFEKIEEMDKQGYPFFIFIDENRKIKLVHLGSVTEEILEGLIYIAFEADLEIK